jgi:membrane associated rhomboid family serine protease
MFGSVVEDLKYKFLQRDSLWVIIIICASVFFFDKTLHLVGLIIGSSDTSFFLKQYFSLPLSLDFIYKPWTFFSYIFLHAGLFHLGINMLMLFWFGNIYQLYLGNKFFTKVFIGGGLTGGMLALLAYLYLPFLKNSNTLLVGASAGVEAIVFASAAINPEHELRLLLFGRVKLKYVAFFSLLINYLSIAGSNSGGVIAHIGGAIFGYFYMKQLQNGKDIFSFADMIGKFLNPSKKLKVTHSANIASITKHQKSDATQEKLDTILDKINQSGYDSLSKEEKAFLFQYSNES